MKMAMVDNFSVLACRVCLSLEKNEIIMNDGNGWLDLFTFCFGLKIHPKEQARSLCDQCALSLKSFAKLKVKCLESDDVWKSRLESIAIEQHEKEFGHHEIKIETDHEESLTNFKDYKEDILELNENDNISIKTEITNYSIELVDLHTVDFENVAKHDDNVACVQIESNNANNDHQSNVGEVPQCGCGVQFSDKTEYKNHTKKCSAIKFYSLPENQNGVLKSCGLCEYSTKDAEVFCQHFTKHHRRNDLECKLCEFTGQDFAEMAFHRYKHMSAERSILHCLKCYKRFQTPKGLQFHFRSVHLGKEKGGLCFCGASFSSVKLWRVHEKTKHYDLEDGNVFICDCCGLRFRYRCHIVAHLRTRSGLDRVTCKECGARFSRQRYLKVHVKNKHSHNERVQCPECPKTITQDNLVVHMKKTHADKNYICEFCSAAYKNPQSFKYHMLGHTKERPYKCNLCNASYKQKSALTLHLRKHTGERPYVCDLCSKGFASSKQLKVHNSVHTNVRRHQCKECDRSFYLKKKLLEHNTKAHHKTVIPGD